VAHARINKRKQNLTINWTSRKMWKLRLAMEMAVMTVKLMRN